MPTDNKWSLTAAQVWRLVTGKEFSVLRAQEKAELEAKKAAAREQARIFYGPDSGDRDRSIA